MTNPMTAATVLAIMQAYCNFRDNLEDLGCPSDSLEMLLAEFWATWEQGVPRCNVLEARKQLGLNNPIWDAIALWWHWFRNPHMDVSIF